MLLTESEDSLANIDHGVPALSCGEGIQSCIKKFLCEAKTPYRDAFSDCASRRLRSFGSCNSLSSGDSLRPEVQGCAPLWRVRIKGYYVACPGLICLISRCIRMAGSMRLVVLKWLVIVK